jgi:HK97 family phage major capsid protein
MLIRLITQENAQLTTGTGVAPNLLGLATNPSVLAVGSAGTDLDAIAAAFAAIRTRAAHCDPDVVVQHPNDWYSAGSLLAKETTGAYLVGSPVTAVKPMLWGVPVILPEYMPENTALVANFKIAATVYVRQPPVVEVASPTVVGPRSSSPTRPSSARRNGWPWPSITPRPSAS